MEVKDGQPGDSAPLAIADWVRTDTCPVVGPPCSRTWPVGGTGGKWGAGEGRDQGISPPVAVFPLRLQLPPSWALPGSSFTPWPLEPPPRPLCPLAQGEVAVIGRCPTPPGFSALCHQSSLFLGQILPFPWWAAH